MSNHSGHFNEGSMDKRPLRIFISNPEKQSNKISERVLILAIMKKGCSVAVNGLRGVVVAYSS